MSPNLNFSSSTLKEHKRRVWTESVKHNKTDCVPGYKNFDIQRHLIASPLVIDQKTKLNNEPGNQKTEPAKAIALIKQRIKELKRFVEEDGEALPLPASEEALYTFLSLFPPAKLPDLTFGDDGCYYLRVVKGQEKLVVLFLSETSMHYLIEVNTEYQDAT